MGFALFALLWAGYEPPSGWAKGVQPGYFTVKLHEPAPLLEVDGPPAEYERVIGAKKYLETPSISQAGAHRDLTVSVVFLVESIEAVLSEEDVPAKYVIQLPAGLVANFGAIPACRLTDFLSTVYDNETAHCSAASQLGVVSVLYGGELPDRSYPLYKINIQNLYGTHGGHLAAIGFPYELLTDRVPIILRVDLRTDSDYGMTLTGRGYFPEFTPAPFFTFWGNPWAPIHDSERWNPETQQWGASVSESPVPFISSPSNCSSGVLESKVQVQYRWEGEHWFPDDPEDFAYRSFLHEAEGCETVEFSPRGVISPTTSEPDSSTGLKVGLELPRGDIAGQETAPLKEITLQLPTGMSVNPATLNGMDGCTPAQIGLMESSGSGPDPAHFALGEAHCPNASKVGIGSADTPLADEPVKAAVYLATPYDNPFHTLIALYLVLESQAFTIKLAAKVDADPVTGQLTVKLDSLPQLPVERLDLRIFDGPRAALSNPVTCGEGSAVAILAPWSSPGSGPPTEIQSRMRFEQRPDAQNSCSEKLGSSALAPMLTVGLGDVTAGAHSPFILRVERPQGVPEMKAVKLTLPRGLGANLQGISYCSNASIALAEERNSRGGGALELGDPSCPAGSRVGSVTVGAGTGSIPLFSKGTVYLAGPYKAAPLSLVVITPAIAGGSDEKPLVDLGTIAVRVALSVDQRTGRITAISDPLPQMIDGIPLRVDDIRLLLNRADFVRGPTSCNEMKVDAEIKGYGGAAARLANRFQMDGCRHLLFRPRFKVDIDGDRNRAPKLQAVVTAGSGEANISRARITFPASLGADTAQIKDACPRPLLLEGRCPRRSIYGHVVVWSPLLPRPLSGPVYATSVAGKPDLLFALAGQVSLIAPGKMSSQDGRLRVVFSGLPDLPLSRLKLSLSRELLGVSIENLGSCSRRPIVVARFTAHSGSVRTRRAVIGDLCAGRTGRKESKRKQLGDGRTNGF